ncbi:hypothetical protein GE300_20020 [Rhodobacteraceae bacterium 2CG4]|uniref:Uracil DNA glycosylase superfamily protein n=1 Tax=Halovulum marinum TaxID=2662447 RepID=A0A6L5Z752_9RHOB|nr:hypothetical protein [Halovulum marinum]MSU91865.1 hypothetical protein [Halovulum marinum]
MNNIYRADLVAGMSADELNREIAEPDRLVIARTPSTKGVREITTVWAPFDHVNRYARVALVSLTPSRIQMRDALRSYRGSRVLGESHADALERASVAGSYTGNMRRRLVAMLDEVGLHHYLDIASTSDLWSNASGKAHFTSCLRWPVFVGGKSYDGSSPGLLGRSDFRFMVEKILAREIASLPPGCLVIPLGAAPNQVVRYLAQSDPGLDRGRILAGIPPRAATASRPGA